MQRQVLQVEGYTETSSTESYFVTPFIGTLPANVSPRENTPKLEKQMPQAYFVEQPPLSTVPPHYHDTNQFQIFLKGSVIFGKKKIEGLCVHYASGHTPYGPITTTNQGAHYLTLRNKWDSGGKTMPASRGKLQKIPRRFRLIDNIELPELSNLSTGATSREDLLAAEIDGLGASIFLFGAKAEATLEMPVPGAGSYGLVMAGHLQTNEHKLVSGSCVHLKRSEKPRFSAGKRGAMVLLVQFPPEPAHHK